MAAPGIPQNLVITQGNGTVALSWDISAGATSYHVKRSTDNVTFADIGTPSENRYLDTTVTVSVPGVQYWYQVSSDNGTESASSATVTAIPTVSGKLSLYELRLMSKQRADRQESEFVTQSEWDSYINQSYFELFDLLVTTYGEEYFTTTFTFATTGASAYDLPDGVNYSGAYPFYKLLGVDLAISANVNARFTVRRFEFIDRNRFTYPQLSGNWMGVFNLQYRVFGNQLIFIPVPSANQNIIVWYIPRMQQLVQDIDICDGVSGWTEYIIVDAAIKALQKEESDVQVLMAQKQALLRRIEDSAQNRDAGIPATISDVRNSNMCGGGWNEPNGGW